MTFRDRDLARIELGAFAVGAVGLVLCAAGPWSGTRVFSASYLAAYLFWLGLSLGCLAVMMLHRLVGGEWGVVTRPLLRAGVRTLPIMLPLFVPVLLGLSTLYPWATPGSASDVARSYLNRPFFLVRAALYFASWIALCFLVPRWGDRLDSGEAPRIAGRLKLLCGWGLVIYGVTVFYSAVDWVLSLEPGWTSTVYGMIVMAGQGLSALAWVTALAGALATRPSLRDAVTPACLHDLGNLLLTFVMLWAYVGFSQYLIVWAGDLPRETSWMRQRTGPGWGAVAGVLLLAHFAVPFLLLLFRRIKRSRIALPILAGALVVVHGLDVFWRVRPAVDPAGLTLHLPDLLAPLTVGGFWIGAYLFVLRRRPPLPTVEVSHA